MTSARDGSGAGPERRPTTDPSRSPPARSPALSGVLDFREDPLVLSEHDIPAVIPPDVFAAVAAHGGAQPGVAHQQLQALDELVAGRVVEARVAFHAVLHQHFAAGVG